MQYSTVKNSNSQYGEDRWVHEAVSDPTKDISIEHRRHAYICSKSSFFYRATFSVHITGKTDASPGYSLNLAVTRIGDSSFWTIYFQFRTRLLLFPFIQVLTRLSEQPLVSLMDGRWAKYTETGIMTGIRSCSEGWWPIDGHVTVSPPVICWRDDR